MPLAYPPKVLYLLAFHVQVSSSCTAILLCQLVCCSGLLQPLLYNSDLTVHAGIACLCCVCWDSMSNLPDLRFVSFACWDSVSSFPGL